MKLRHVVIGTLLVASCAAIVACGKKPTKGFLENASPETSAMALYCFDGENTTLKYLFDDARKKQIIAEVNALKTTKRDASKIEEMSAPYYGISISDKDGIDIWLTYSNGIWLQKDGSVYEAKYDLKSVYDSVATDVTYSYESGVTMLNAAYLVNHDRRFYYKSTAGGSEKDGISLAFISKEGNKVTLSVKNDREEEYVYDEYFALEREVDGEWYVMPYRLSNYAFWDIAHIIPAHESVEVTCDLTVYGELEPGRYRVEKSKLTAEFQVE